MVAVAIVVIVWPGASQGGPASPEFEVASVKWIPPDGSPTVRLPDSVAEYRGFSGGPGSRDPGMINYSKVSLKMLLARAYNMRPKQISGPSWLETETYTIVAKLSADTTMDQFRPMLQKLLIERFHLNLHHEDREIPVFFLKVARNGPKLNPPVIYPTYEDAAKRQQRQAEEDRARVNDVIAHRAPPKDTRRFSLSGATMEQFAEILSGNLDRPVRDLTHLEGKYYFELAWTISRNPSILDGDESSEPSVFAAIEQQLGLKLESGKTHLEILVIDKAEKIPISN